MDGWHDLLYGDGAGGRFVAAKDIPAKYAEHAGELEHIVQKLLEKAVLVYPKAHGDHSAFRYFMMLSIQSLTVFATKDAAPCTMYAFVFDRLDAGAQRSMEACQSDIFVRDLSNNLTQVKADNRSLRDDLTATRNELRFTRSELAFMRDELAAGRDELAAAKYDNTELRRLNCELMSRKLSPYI